MKYNLVYKNDIHMQLLGNCTKLDHLYTPPHKKNHRSEGPIIPRLVSLPRPHPHTSYLSLANSEIHLNIRKSISSSRKTSLILPKNNQPVYIYC